jgi:galactokinase
MAKLCQRAENEYAGARCGIMDQFVCAHAEANRALFLDCRSLEYELPPLAPEFTLVACNTMVKHDLATGAYNQRRAECEQGVQLLGQILPNVRALRDVTPGQLQVHAAKLPPIVFRRCRHVVAENERVVHAAACLKRNDIASFGQLMGESHRSLRDDYEVSCAELDLMVEIANHVEGIMGARMTGGGFGGCTINVVRSECVRAFTDRAASEYHRQTGLHPGIYVSRPAGRAQEVLHPDVPVES